MSRKTYRTKRAALKAANGREVYPVKGPPKGYRISRGAKVRGKRGRALRRRKRLKARRRRSRKKTDQDYKNQGQSSSGDLRL